MSFQDIHGALGCLTNGGKRFTSLDSGTLFVVATPIGNLEDLTPRARQILSDVDLIAAEDTRHTGRLLSHFGIKSRQISLHEHNEPAACRRLLSALKDGKSVALVSDAGTPLISDPGYRLVKAAHAECVPVSPVPGASAVTAALSVAGLPTDKYCFEGFLPSKAAARKKRVEALRDESRTLVLYESVHRIEDTIRCLNDVMGSERRAFVGRELSKVHEQCVSTTLGDIHDRIAEGQIPLKGEFVVAIEANPQPDTETATIGLDRLIAEVAAAMPASAAADLLASLTGRRRNEIYRRVLAQRDAMSDS